MNKDKKISFLDYFIVVFIVIFFAIVSMYSYVIWPREEKFKKIDRSRMERISDAEFLYKDLTGDYTDNSFRLFALMEAVRDTLYGDSLFEGKRDIVLAKKIKRYVINNQIVGKVDTLFVDGTAAFSFEFAEGVKLYSIFALDRLGLLLKDSINTTLDSLVQEQILSNLITHNTNREGLSNQTKYKIDIDNNYFDYSIKDYYEYVDSNVYAITPSDFDSSLVSNAAYYKSDIDGKILNSKKDLEDVTVSIDIPKGFRYKLDTTFTNPIKIEEKYNDTIVSIRVLSFDPTENFIDNLNGVYDKGEDFTDVLNGYWDEGEEFEDVIGNYIYDEGEKFYDGQNGYWDKGEDFTDIGDGKWGEGEEFIDAGNGKYDEGEDFKDVGNGVYDEGEEFVDALNGKYDKGDMTFKDKNGNGIWEKGEFVDIVGNGKWDEGEDFTDIGNGKWDESEDFEDGGNGKYDKGEKFIDIGNKKYDEGEDFVDSGKNGKYDKGEIFIDIIGNGIYDKGEEFVDALNSYWDEGEEFVDSGQDGCFDQFEDGKGGCLQEVSKKYKPGKDPNFDNYSEKNNYAYEGNGKYDKGEKFVDAVNNIYDKGEDFQDKSDGRYNKGEDFQDGKNGVYDEGEVFIDGPNGYWDEGEKFVDALNSYWDEGEEFVDALNGFYDEGVDQYYHIQYIKSNSLTEYIGEKFIDIGNGKWDEGEEFVDIGNEIWEKGEFVDIVGNGKWDEGEEFIDIGNGVYDEAENFIDVNYNGKCDPPNGYWDKGEEFVDSPNGEYDRGEKFTDKKNGFWDSPEEFSDENGNGKWDLKEPFEDRDHSGAWTPGEIFLDCNQEQDICEGSVNWKRSMGNEKWDEGEFFKDDLNEIWDEGERFEDVVGNGIYDEDEEFIDGEEYQDKNNNGKWDSSEEFSDENGNGKYDKRNLMFLDQLPGNEILERKTVYMDYISKIDTLSMDSLYSSILNFKNTYVGNDLFLIDVTRFDNELIKIDVEDQLGFEYKKSPDIDSILSSDETYNKNRFFCSIPFLADTVYIDLYYKNKEEKDIVVSSPVPKNEKWQYWQKIYSSNESYFNIPTPFSFYTGSHGEINNGEKSWAE